MDLLETAAGAIFEAEAAGNERRKLRKQLVIAKP
jgi:hypothetical protein